LGNDVSYRRIRMIPHETKFGKFSGWFHKIHRLSKDSFRTSL